MENITPAYLTKKMSILIEIYTLLKAKLETLTLLPEPISPQKDIKLEIDEVGNYIKKVDREIKQLSQQSISNIGFSIVINELQLQNSLEATNRIEDKINDIALGLDAYANETPEVYYSYKIHIKAYNRIEHAIRKVDIIMLSLIRSNRYEDKLFQLAKKHKDEFKITLRKLVREREKTFSILKVQDSFFREDALNTLNYSIENLAQGVENQLGELTLEPLEIELLN